MKSKLYKSLLEEEKELTDSLNAVRNLITRYKPDADDDDMSDVAHVKTRKRRLKKSDKIADAASEAKPVKPGTAKGSKKRGRPALASKRGRKPKDNIPTADRPYYAAVKNIPAKYEKSLSQVQKTIFALNKLKTGYSNDIAKNLSEYDTGISFEEVKKFVVYHLSKFYRLKLISGKKTGIKNKYVLKD